MDDRSERLRKRRKQSIEKSDSRPDSTEQSFDSSGQDNQSPHVEDTTGNSEGTADPADENQTHTPIKEKQTGTYMYLPDTQVRELRRLYNVLKAEYEFEYDEEFEKNRHFYPLVIQYGLESLDGSDVSEIRAYLDDFYE